jgi:hypothetical protein
MNVGRRTISTVVVILLCVVGGSIHANPNHLEPIPAYDPDGYNQAVFQSFIGKRRLVELWMIERPSFAMERAVSLDHEKDTARW